MNYILTHPAVLSVSRDINNVNERLTSLESSVWSLHCKLDAIAYNMQAPSQSAPPGLSFDPRTEDLDSVRARLNLLEKVFVLTDFDSIQEAADCVLSSNKEPECESTPEKQIEPTLTPPLSCSKSLYFDLYDATRDVSTQCEADFDVCRAELRTDPHSQLESFREMAEDKVGDNKDEIRDFKDERDKIEAAKIRSMSLTRFTICICLCRTCMRQ